MSARPLPIPVNPALLQHAEERRKRLENRVADQITRFAGSMTFVYLHVIWFAAWIGLGVEHYPFGLLTMIVSLEAIFLSTFVMISQNRADEKRQVLADHQWQTVQEEEQQNEELLQLSNQILELTRAIHAMNSPRSPTGSNGTEQAARSSIRNAMGMTRSDGRGETGDEPVFADLPDLGLSLTSTRVIDERLVLLDHRVADRSGDGRG